MYRVHDGTMYHDGQTIVRVERGFGGGWKACRVSLRPGKRPAKKFLPNLLWATSPTLAQARLDGFARAKGWRPILERRAA